MSHPTSQIESSNYLIIGNGRMARHMRHYFSLLNVDFTTWSRKENTPEELSDLCQRCSRILLLVKDEALEGLLHQHRELFVDKDIVHFSGAHTLNGAWSAHPLMSFSEELYDLGTYEKVPFITEASPEQFQNFFPKLRNACFTLKPNLKPLYHALCVASGNFTIILWQVVRTRFAEQLGLPPEVLDPYLQQTFNNLANSSKDVLTGPLARRDRNTIAKNLKSLKGDPLEGVYHSFLELMNLGDFIK